MNTLWVKIRLGDELGLTDDDLSRIYGISSGTLDKYLTSLGSDAEAVSARILSDVDAARIRYKQMLVTESHIAQLHELLRPYIFHPFVPIAMADGRSGWRLSNDDAQWIAFRAADIVGMDFEWSDILRKRLNRLVIWPISTAPELNQAFYDRLTNVTTYLVELAGVM